MTMLVACGGSTEVARGDEEPAREVEAGSETEVRVVPEIWLEGGGTDRVRVRIQVADDDFERERGLMYRRHLDRDAGMLFVFDPPEDVSFWMENTYIPLDVLFIDDALTIVGIVTDTVPLSLDPIEIGRPSRFVLEVNAGFVRTHGIAPGGQIELRGVSLPPQSR
jgi:hypothetical protein